MLYPEHIPFTEALLQWFHTTARPLPWRGHYDPYAVWISEIMLQQTQMERGVLYYKRWMEKFPTLAHVANAHDEEILKAWEGLGYYSRARNLHKAAQRVMHEHAGVFPENYEDIRSLPGIGDYTAGAIASIAYNVPVAAVDANVRRVFARIFDIDTPIAGSAADDFIRHMAEALIPEGKARLFNQALMELGALICNKAPRCLHCPVNSFCRAYSLGIVAERPILGKKTEYTALEIISGVLVHQGRIFIQKRPESGVWAGFWEFPGGKLEAGETPEQGICREFLEETEFSINVTHSFGTVRHAYTRYRITMHCFACCLSPCANVRPARESLPLADSLDPTFPIPTLHAATEYRWATFSDLDALTFPAGHRKFMEMYRSQLEQIMQEGCSEAAG